MKNYLVGFAVVVSGVFLLTRIYRADDVLVFSVLWTTLSIFWIYDVLREKILRHGGGVFLTAIFVVVAYTITMGLGVGLFYFLN